MSVYFHFYVFGVNIDRPGDANQDAFGVFNQTTFSLLDNLRVITGVRWSRESQDNGSAFDTTSCAIPAGEPLTFDEIFAFDASSPGCNVSPVPYAEETWRNTSWKGGIEWDINEDTMLYFSVTNGFKSGQVQPGLPAFFDPFVDPEELINYELGIKSGLFDGALDLRAAIFNMDYEDIQVTAVTAVDDFSYIFTQNAANAQIYGAEVEWQYQVTSSDQLSGFVAYTDATYGEYRNAVDGQTGDVIPSLEGNTLSNVPEFSARVQYARIFDLPGGGTLTPVVAVYYQSKSYLREFNFDIDRIDAYTKTSINLTYDDPSEHWKVTAFVHNLEDETIRNTGNTAVNSYFSDYHAPRQYGIRVGYEF